MANVGGNSATLVLRYTEQQSTIYKAKAAEMAASRLAGRTIFITGASSGIGRATAQEFVNQAKGHNINLILAARRIDALKDIASKLESQGASVYPVKLDVSKLDEIKEVLANLPDKFKNVDCLLNNAGFVVGTEHVGDIEPEILESMFATNVNGLIHLTQEFVRLFKKQGKGDIVNIGSIAGREPYPGGSIYCASKAAVAAFTAALRKELISTRIRVLQVDPGQVLTEFSLVRMRGSQEKADAIYQGVDPLTPEDIAEIIVFGVSRPENVVLAETLVFPSHQAGAGSVHRRQ
jgi:3-hydroxy acid dehydrogenase/malonic semialdehyde reductase